MQVPAIPYRTAESHPREFGPLTVATIGAVSLLSVFVWGLAIAKLIDLYRVL